MSDERQTRRNVLMPDSLWRALERRAAELAGTEGKPVSASEALRRILTKALAKREKQ